MMDKHVRLAQVLESPAAAITSAFWVAVAAMLNGVNVALFVLLLLSFVLDQVSGMLKAVVEAPRGKRWFDGHKFRVGAAGKGLILVGVAAAGILEMVFMMIPSLGEVVAQLNPITVVALSYAIIGQLGSVASNLAVVKEARLLSAFMIRRMDAAKLGHEPPVRREAYDEVAVEMEKGLETLDNSSFHDAAHERDRKKREGGT